MTSPPPRSICGFLLVTMVLSPTVSEINSDTGGETPLFVPHLYFTLPLMVLRSEFCSDIWAQKLKVMDPPFSEKNLTDILICAVV